MSALLAYGATMSRIRDVIFVRSGCAFILGCITGLIGLVGWAAWTAQTDYPRSPPAIVWAAVGGAFSFVVGACIGNRRLKGRPAWLVAGLVAGMLAGAAIGWQWAHAEYGFARAQLLHPGVPPEPVDPADGGPTCAEFEIVGLQYGICLGILGGTTAGWFWKQPPRSSTIANLFPVWCSCFVALGAIGMINGFRDLSRDAIEHGRQFRLESQSEARAAADRSDFGSLKN